MMPNPSGQHNMKFETAPKPAEASVNVDNRTEHVQRTERRATLNPEKTCAPFSATGLRTGGCVTRVVWHENRHVAR
jgi:hypothetical protein